MNKLSIDIPLIPCKLNVFVGQSSFDGFLQECQKKNLDWVFENDVSGYCYENNIWVFNLDSPEIIFHECQHFYDWLFEYLHCKDESEFKAYLFSYINIEIVKILKSTKKVRHIK